MTRVGVNYRRPCLKTMMRVNRFPPVRLYARSLPQLKRLLDKLTGPMATKAAFVPQKIHSGNTVIQYPSVDKFTQKYNQKKILKEKQMAKGSTRAKKQVETTGGVNLHRYPPPPIESNPDEELRKAYTDPFLRRVQIKRIVGINGIPAAHAFALRHTFNPIKAVKKGKMAIDSFLEKGAVRRGDVAMWSALLDECGRLGDAHRAIVIWKTQLSREMRVACGYRAATSVINSVAEWCRLQEKTPINDSTIKFENNFAKSKDSNKGAKSDSSNFVDEAGTVHLSNREMSDRWALVKGALSVYHDIHSILQAQKTGFKVAIEGEESNESEEIEQALLQELLKEDHERMVGRNEFEDNVQRSNPKRKYETDFLWHPFNALIKVIGVGGNQNMLTQLIDGNLVPMPQGTLADIDTIGKSSLVHACVRLRLFGPLMNQMIEQFTVDEVKDDPQVALSILMSMNKNTALSLADQGKHKLNIHGRKELCKFKDKRKPARVFALDQSMIEEVKVRRNGDKDSELVVLTAYDIVSMHPINERVQTAYLQYLAPDQPEKLIEHFERAILPIWDKRRTESIERQRTKMIKADLARQRKMAPELRFTKEPTPRTPEEHQLQKAMDQILNVTRIEKEPILPPLSLSDDQVFEAYTVASFGKIYDDFLVYIYLSNLSRCSPAKTMTAYELLKQRYRIRDTPLFIEALVIACEKLDKLPAAEFFVDVLQESRNMKPTMRTAKLIERMKTKTDLLPSMSSVCNDKQKQGMSVLSIEDGK